MGKQRDMITYKLKYVGNDPSKYPLTSEKAIAYVQ